MSANPPRVVLFGRAAVSGDQTRQRAVESRLRSLAEAGRIAAVDRRWWSARVRTPVEDDSPRAAAVEWFERLGRWAEREGVAVEPAFARHERASEFTGERYEEYVFPVLAVAVLRDDEVVAAAPHVAETGDQVGVRDVVERLADAANADATPAAVASE
jgi:hypothetical protein